MLFSVFIENPLTVITILFKSLNRLSLGLENKRALKFSINNLDNAMKALFKKDYKLADQVVTSCLLASKMERKILNLNIKLSQEQNACLTSMLEHIKRVSDHSADIGEVVINLTIE